MIRDLDDVDAFFAEQRRVPPVEKSRHRDGQPGKLDDAVLSETLINARREAPVRHHS